MNKPERVIVIEIQRLENFKENPFQVKDDESVITVDRERWNDMHIIIFIIKIPLKLILFPVWMILVIEGVVVSVIIGIYNLGKNPF